MNTPDTMLDIQARYAAEYLFTRSKNPKIEKNEALCLLGISQILLKMADDLQYWREKSTD